MPIWKLSVAYLLLSIISVQLFGNVVSSTNNKVKVEFDAKNNCFYVKGLAKVYKITGKFELYNGKIRKYIHFPNKSIKKNGNKIILNYSNSKVDWKLSLIPKLKIILVHSKLTNRSDKELWLQPGITLKLDNSKPIKRAWDGWGVDYKFATKEIGHKGVKGPVEKHVGASSRPFPVAAVFSENDALFAGGLPFEPVSYEAASISPKNNAKTEIKYSIRTAILPKKTTEIKFVIGAVKAQFGGKEAVVQSYYDSFPELWTPAVGKDNPYLWGQHGEYINWKGKPKLETSRRLYIVNEWTYCPYKRSGDIACRAMLWNYKPLGNPSSPMVFQRRIDFTKISRKDYLAFREKIFKKNAQKYGLMFYLTTAGTWCEAQLAKKHYPDALVKDKDVRCFLRCWSTARDHEVRVFPMGTSFAKALHKDIKYLVKELDLPGFAFDCSYGGAYYRGPAVKKDLPGRAWDARGVFIDQSVAINNLVDYIHKLPPSSNNKNKLFIFANGYLKGDYMMMEKPFMGVGTYKRWFPLLKYHIGPRPTTAHGHGYLLKETIPNWRKKTNADFKQIMSRLADYVIFNCFKYASFPSSYTINYGVPQTVYILPELIEMVRAGWQAEIPLKIENSCRKTYAARYGKGVDSYFFLGNPYPQDFDSNITADCSYLDDFNCLLLRKMRKSAETKLSISKRKVSFNVTLKSRIPYLYESICGISPLKIKYSCRTSSKKDLDQQTYIIKFQTQQSFRAKLKFRNLRNFKLDSVMLNNKEISFDNYCAAVLIGKGAKLSIRYKSKQFFLTEKKLLSFPFVDSSQKINFKIAVPAKPAKEELEAAEMLKEYFIFCASKYVIAGHSPKAEIIKTDKIPVQGNWISISKTAKDSVRIEGNILYIEGRKIKELLKTTEYVMDNRFHYSFPFRGTMGLYNHQLKHFKMWGKTLPYKKYFKTSIKSK